MDRRTELLVKRNAERALANRVPIGTRFATMVVIGYVHRKPRWSYVVQCDCGVRKETQLGDLKRSKSCGCLTNKIISAARTRHGETHSPTWNTWKSMIDRCELLAHKSYADYGGRGISVCQSWHVYENFVRDMGRRPAGLQLDRVDNEKGYVPGNCRWSTPKQNCNNRRNSVWLELDGEKLTLVQWSERIGSGSYCAIQKRLQNGWSVLDALTKPFKMQKNSRIYGREKTETLSARV